MQIDERQAYQIHGILSSDSDSDFGGKDEFDEEYNALKPPPLDYESIRDRIVLISREQTRNVWQERFESEERFESVKNDEGETQTATTATKKKKKKSKTKVAASDAESTGVATIGREKLDSDFPELKMYEKESPKRDQALSSSSSVNSDSIAGAKPKKNQPKAEKQERLKDSQEQIWHSGMSGADIEQQLKMERQREASMYDFWMKLARNQSESKEYANNRDKTVKKEEKAKKKSEPSSVETSKEKVLQDSEDMGKKILKNEKTATSKSSSIEASKNGAQYATCSLLNQEMLQRTWHYDDFAHVNMQRLTDAETEKKSKAKKKPKKKPGKLTNGDNASVTEPSSVGSTIEEDSKKSPAKARAQETPEGSQDEGTQTQKSIGKAVMESLWVLPHNTVTGVQSVTDREAEAEDTRRGEVTSTTVDKQTTKKTKKTKKKKQLTVEPQPSTDSTNLASQNGEKTNEESDKLKKQETIRENSNGNVESNSNRGNTRVSNDSKPINETAPTEEPRVFDEEFRDFIQNIAFEDTDLVSNLTGFRYEQLHRAYAAYRARRYRDASTNTAATQNFVHTQNYHQTYYVGSPNPSVIFVPAPMTNYGNPYGINRFAGAVQPPQMSGHFQGTDNFQGNAVATRNSFGMAVTYPTVNGQPRFENPATSQLFPRQIDGGLLRNRSTPNNPVPNGNGIAFDERIARYSPPNCSGPRYHSVGPNDNFRPNAYRTPVYDAPTTSSRCPSDAGTGDFRENVDFNQDMERLSEKQNSDDRSPERLGNVAETRSLVEDERPVEDRMSRREEPEEMMDTILYFFLVGLAGVLVANLITSLVSFLFDNMIFIMLFVFICIKFRSAQQ